MDINDNPLPPLVDSHCHLDFSDFDTDLAKVISRAEKARVLKILTICTKPQNLKKVISIANNYPNIYFAAGTHPLTRDETEKFTKDELLKVAVHPKMLGIGETGLDYFYSAEHSTEQKKHFRLHIATARECSLPLIVHSRSADEDMSRILREEHKNGPFDCVMHCFSAGEKLAKLAIDLGFYLSISGIATFPKSTDLRNLFSKIPINRLLLETDSPYLAPPPFRGRRNEPSYVALTAKVMAKHFGIPESSLRKTTSNNFNQLFKKINT